MDNLLSVIIVDDEVLGREFLGELISNDGRFNVVSSCSNGPEAIAEFQRHKPQVIFLDLQMPGMNGFEVCQKLDLTDSNVVFVTAFGEYALTAFDVGAVDYVTKPIRPDRFKVTLDRVAAVCSRASGASSTATSVDDSQKARVTTIHGELFFHPAEIQFLEGSGNYVKIWIDDRCHLVRETLKNLIERFDKSLYFRVHRSFVVNTSKVLELVRGPSGSAELILENCSSRIPVSRSRREQVIELLNDRVPPI